jgi:hypothetical protein
VTVTKRTTADTTRLPLPQTLLLPPPSPVTPLVPTGTAPHVVDEVDLISSDDDERTAAAAAPLAAKNQGVSPPAASRKRQAPDADTVVNDLTHSDDDEGTAACTEINLFYKP